MNKTEFINTLSKHLSYPMDKCVIINDILESNFFIGQGNKNKITSEITKKLNIEKEEAEQIYNTAIKIIKDELKYKLKHPFNN